MKNKWPNYTVKIAEDILSSDDKTSYLSVIMKDNINYKGFNNILEKRFKVTKKNDEYSFFPVSFSNHSNTLVGNLKTNQLRLSYKGNLLTIENFFEICFFQWVSESLQNLNPETKILTELYRLNFFSFNTNIPIIFFPENKDIQLKKTYQKIHKVYIVKCTNVIAFKNFFKYLDFNVGVMEDDIHFKFSDSFLEENNLGYFKTIPFSLSMINSSVFNEISRIYLKAIMKHILINLKEINFDLTKIDSKPNEK